MRQTSWIDGIIMRGVRSLKWRVIRTALMIENARTQRGVMQICQNTGLSEQKVLEYLSRTGESVKCVIDYTTQHRRLPD